AVAAGLVAAPPRGDLARPARSRLNGIPTARDHRLGLPIDSRRHPLSWYRLVGIALLRHFDRCSGRLAVANHGGVNGIQPRDQHRVPPGTTTTRLGSG